MSSRGALLVKLALQGYSSKKGKSITYLSIKMYMVIKISVTIEDASTSTLPYTSSYRSDAAQTISANKIVWPIKY